MTNMNNMFYSNIRTLVVLLICTLSTTLFAQSNQIKFDQANYNYNGNATVPIEVELTSTPGFSGTIRLTLPAGAGFTFNPNPPTINHDNKMIINSVVVTGTEVVDINFTFDGELASIASFTIENVRFPIADPCGNQSFPFDLKLFEENNPIEVSSDVENFTVLQKSMTMTTTHSIFSELNCRDPFFHAFRIYGASIPPGTMEADYIYNSAKFNVHGLYYQAGASWIPVTYQENVAGTLEFDPIIGGAFNKTYQVALSLKDCIAGTGLNEPFTVNLQYVEPGISCNIAASFTETLQDDLNCCGDFGGTPKPYITNQINPQCAEDCSLRLFVTVFNVGTGTDFTDLQYTLDFPESVTILNVQAYPNTAGNSSTGSSSISHQDQSITLNDGNIHTLTIDYVFNGTPSTTDSMLIQQTLSSVSNGGLLDTKPYTIYYSSCTPQIRVNEFAIENTSYIQGSSGIFDLENNNPIEIEAFIRVWRQFNRPFAVNNFSFEYQLNDHLVLASTPEIEFYYGSTYITSLNSGDFQPVGSVPEIASFSISPDNKTVTFSGINLPKDCPVDDNFVIKIKLQSYAQLGTGSLVNGFVKSSGPSWIVRRLNWKASGSDVVQGYTQPACEETNFFENSNDFYVNSADPFYYHYVVKTSSQKITNTTMLGSLPHLNDEFILNPGLGRGSQINGICASDINVAVEQDLNGTITTTQLTPLDYDLDFSSDLNDLCIDLTDLSTIGTCTEVSTPNCTGSPIFFKLKLINNYQVPIFSRLVLSLKTNVAGGNSGETGNASFAFTYDETSFVQESGIGTIEISATSSCGEPPPCVECENSFAPLLGKKYVLSAWVKEANMPGAVTYENANITLFFTGNLPSNDVTVGPFLATGEIIDGWQQIQQEFTVPLTAVKIRIELNNSGGGQDVYFDDIRIHPFDANMKSFVYDPVTLRLSAELDERNYATFYEYDEEGALIRVKKETSRGVMTIQESRNATRKQP